MQYYYCRSLNSFKTVRNYVPPLRSGGGGRGWRTDEARCDNKKKRLLNYDLKQTVLRKIS
jgi:hypothetical protein